MNFIIGRVLFSFILLFVLILFPWWFFFLVGVGGIFIFRNYFEFVFIAFLFDLLYGPGSTLLLSEKNLAFSFVLSLTAIFVILILEKFKKNLVIYND